MPTLVHSSARSLPSGCGQRVLGVADWRVSPHDGTIHAFEVKPEAGFCAALCEHSALTDRLEDVELHPDAKPCLGCMLIDGDRIAEQAGDAFWRD